MIDEETLISHNPLRSGTIHLDVVHNWGQLLARNVKHFRRLKNISQESLASECGIFRTYLSRIETGKSNPSLSVLVALAASLGVTPNALLVPIE